MRNISPASLAKLTQKTGVEPVLVLEVEWTDADFFTPALYADRGFRGAGPNGRDIEGRILTVANIDDALNFQKSNTNQQVAVTLSDTDGVLKNIFDNTDIHNRPVAVYQWFTGLAYSERFLLFRGVIASPITWSESARTLSFTVLSRVQDREVGFSIEDGFFPEVPQGLIGKAWPLVFGTACFVPALLVDEIPHGSKLGNAADSFLKDPFGIHDPAIDKRLIDNGIKAAFDMSLAKADFVGYLEASSKARRNGELGPFDDISVGKGPFSQLARQFLAAGNKLLAEAQKINQKSAALKDTLKNQKSFETAVINATNGNNFPQNTPITLQINGASVTGFFVGDQFTVTDASHPNAEITNGLVIDPLDTRVGEPIITRNQYFFADAGTPLQVNQTISGEDLATLLLDPPATSVRYIVALGTVNILAVYAYRTVNNYRSIYVVPPDHFQATVVDFGGGIQATVLVLPQPLSAYGEGWEDEVWTTCTGAVGPNIVDIMTWLIENYSIFNIDTTSFDARRTELEPFPANFALLNRPNIIKLLQDIAYQSRCVIYLKNDTFFLKNLAIEDDVVDTITEADIIHPDSLVIETTPTEDLTTKYVAKWQADYINRQQLEIIFRYNILQYGLHEKTYEYFIYNQQGLVNQMAVFWIIREANAFKMLKFKTPISKLNLETLDTITLNFAHPYVANGPVNGVIQSAAFNSSDFTIDFTVWVPVRLGEMVNYRFVYPGSITEQDVWPTENDITTFRANATSATNPQTGIGAKPFSGDKGNGGLTVTIGPHQPLSWGGFVDDDTFATNFNPIITTRVPLPGDYNPFTHTGGQYDPGTKKPKGTTIYQLDQQNTEQAVTPAATAAGNSTFPGKVVSPNGDGTYQVDVFENGPQNDPTSTETVRQLNIDASDGDIPANTWTLVTKLEFNDPSNNNIDTIQWVMQVSVWE